MKILLVDAPFYRLQGSTPSTVYPLGLAYITSYLKNEGHDSLYFNLDGDPSIPFLNPLSVSAIKAEYDNYLQEVSDVSSHQIWQDYIEVLKVFRPDVVGISIPSVKAKSVFKLLKITKSVASRIYTVVGGHHSQVYAKDMLENDKNLDFVIRDEGEITMVELARQLENPASFHPESILGLVYRDSAGNIKVNERRPFIEDLDKLPWPSFCYYKKGDELIAHPKTAIMASRGCPYDCNYCATNNMWARRVRMRSPDNVIKEIKHIIVSQKGRFLTFCDDCFTLNKKWLVELCDIIIKDKIKINWDCITSINLLDEAIFRKIVEAGCVKVNVAIESGSQRILKLVNKNIDFGIVRKLFPIFRKYKISTAVYVMVGFPTETEYDIRLTQGVIQELRPNRVYCSVLLPLPGTVCYEQCIERGLLDLTNAWRGDSIKSTVMNLTTTLTDEEFYRLADETFDICYKINTNVFNLMRCVPVMSYLKNPSSLFFDAIRMAQYLKKR
jgi:radical SAM superfamily enzyme YgiQ (UPF0313 family)